MPMAVKPIPEGYHSVTPYLSVNGAERLIEFLKQAFGAEERERFLRPDGHIMHAEVKIGDSIIMLGEANEQWPARPTAPTSMSPTRMRPTARRCKRAPLL